MSQQCTAWVRRVRRVLGLTVGVMGVACGNHPPPATPPTPQVTLCSLASPDAGVAVVPTLRWNQWATLLLRGYSEGSTPAAVTDCTGTATGWTEPSVHCADPGEESYPLATRALTEDDVVVQRTTGSQRLVWIQAQGVSTGEVQGPVALAEFTNGQVQVRAIGTLRNFPRRARLRLETLGDQRILVAEGERCETPDDPMSCRRALRILQLRGSRFGTEAMRFEGNGRCIGPARFPYEAERTRTLPNGWVREFKLHTALQYRAASVLVHEQVDVDDRDPRRPALPPVPFRRAGSDRLLWLLDGHLVSNERSLWYRVLEEEASVTADDAGRRDASADVDDADYVDDATAH